MNSKITIVLILPFCVFSCFYEQVDTYLYVKSVIMKLFSIMMENCSQRMKQQKPRKVTNFLAFLSSHSTFSSAFLPRSNCHYILIRLSRYISLIMQVLVTYFTNSLNKHYNDHYIELLKVIQSHWIKFINFCP